MLQLGCSICVAQLMMAHDPLVYGRTSPAECVLSDVGVAVQGGISHMLQAGGYWLTASAPKIQC